MAKGFRPVSRDQAFLLPPDMRDWLPTDHLVWFILDTLEHRGKSWAPLTVQTTVDYTQASVGRQPLTTHWQSSRSAIIIPRRSGTVRATRQVIRPVHALKVRAPGDALLEPCTSSGGEPCTLGEPVDVAAGDLVTHQHPAPAVGDPAAFRP
jgi:hypothetical protein